MRGSRWVLRSLHIDSAWYVRHGLSWRWILLRPHLNDPPTFKRPEMNWNCRTSSLSKFNQNVSEIQNIIHSAKFTTFNEFLQISGFYVTWLLEIDLRRCRLSISFYLESKSFPERTRNKCQWWDKDFIHSSSLHIQRKFFKRKPWHIRTDAYSEHTKQNMARHQRVPPSGGSSNEYLQSQRYTQLVN